MKRYLFLLAWVSGSESEEDNYDPELEGSSKVKSQEDLKTEFLNLNEHIFAREIHAPDSVVASALGYKEAFFDNYTAHDSLSICEEIAAGEELPMGTLFINYDALVTESLNVVEEKLEPASDAKESSNDIFDYLSNTND